jgi:hypothetical protein
VFDLVGCVVADGDLVLAGAHAVEPDPLPTAQTVFRIASMTKSFTAASILILRDRGLLHLDDAVADIAPEFSNLEPPTRDSPRITDPPSAVDGRGNGDGTMRGRIGISTSATTNSIRTRRNGV